MLKKLTNEIVLADLFKYKYTKTAIALGISLLTASIATKAFAYVEGFYVGGGVNYTWFTYGYDVKERNISDDRRVSDKNNNEASGNKAGGQVILGYTWLLPNDKYFVSLEGFADFYSVEAKQSWAYTTQPGATSNLKGTARNAYGLVVKPGVSITDKVNLFVQGGIAFSQLKDIAYATTFTEPSYLPILTTTAPLDNENLFGYRIGLGAQYVLTENFVAELSWALTYYDGFTQNQPTAFSSTGQPDSDAKLKFDAIRTNQVFLNLIYYFE